MEWTHSDVIGLANVRCANCGGSGLLRIGRPPAPAKLRWSTQSDHRRNSPCNCVLRNIFRACLQRFHDCATTSGYCSVVKYEYSPGVDAMRSWGRHAEDYKADLYLIAKRTLSASDFQIFRLHFLLGCEWSVCCRLLKLAKHTFFHSSYRVQQQLGRVYRETRPYSLFPLDEYFGGTMRKMKVAAFPAVEESKPLRRAA